jgi:hypothetical protein
MSVAGVTGTGQPAPTPDPQGIRVKSLDILLAAGANINARITDSHTHTAKLMSYVQGRDQEGRTALIGASDDGSEAVVLALIARGADLAARGADGKSALDLAREAPPYIETSENKRQRDALIAGRAATVLVLEAEMRKAGIPVPPPPAPLPPEAQPTVTR